MINPDRHTNLDISVLNIVAFILGRLSEHYEVSYDKLMVEVINSIGEDAKENYPYAINFLFLIGKINYDEQNDTFKITNAAQ